MTDQRRPRTDHRSIAARLKACPQYELAVATVPDKVRARVMASQIRGSKWATYQPKGSFQARWAPSTDGPGWTVYACYIGDPTRREAA